MKKSETGDLSELEQIAAQLVQLRERRDQLIALLIESTGAPRIASATGLTTTGVYKIRNRQSEARSA